MITNKDMNYLKSINNKLNHIKEYLEDSELNDDLLNYKKYYNILSDLKDITGNIYIMI